LQNRHELNACSTNFEYIKGLLQWFDNSHLRKELCCGNQNRIDTASILYEQVIIKGVKVEQVSNLKYLATILIVGSRKMWNMYISLKTF